MKKQEDLLKKLKDHEPVIVKYEEGIILDENKKEYSVGEHVSYAEWDDEIQKYRDDMGIWDTKVLIEIASGKVPHTSLEIPNGI